MKTVFFSKKENMFYTTEQMTCSVCAQEIQGAGEWFIAWFSNKPAIHQFHHYMCKWKKPLEAGLAKMTETYSIVYLPHKSLLPQDAKIRPIMPPEVVWGGKSTFAIADDRGDGAKIIDRTKHSFRQEFNPNLLAERDARLIARETELREKPADVSAWLEKNIVNTFPAIEVRQKQRIEYGGEKNDEVKNSDESQA